MFISLFFYCLVFPHGATHRSRERKKEILARSFVLAVFIHHSPFGVYYYNLVKWLGYYDVGDNQRSSNNVVHFLIAKRKNEKQKRKTRTLRMKNPRMLSANFAGDFIVSFGFVNISILLPFYVTRVEGEAFAHCLYSHTHR